MNLEKVIKGCVKNNRSSQQEFYIEYSPKLMGISLRMSPDDDKAKDLLQDAFIKIFGKLGTLDNYEPAVVYSWCKRILTNTILDHYRKTKFERKNVFSSDNIKNPNPYHDHGHNGDIALFSRNEEDSYLESKNVTSEMIMTALKTLPPQYKLVFNLYIMDGYTHQEIGDTLEISVGTSKSNLSKAKEKIRKEIALCQ